MIWNKISKLILAICFLCGACMVTASTSESPVLKWSSKNEEGLYGYNVYRSMSPSGPFLRINARIVPRNGVDEKKKQTGHTSYRYVDESAKPDTSYYYYVDAIAENGRRKQLTQVIRRGSAPP